MDEAANIEIKTTADLSGAQAVVESLTKIVAGLKLEGEGASELKEKIEALSESLDALAAGEGKAAGKLKDAAAAATDATGEHAKKTETLETGGKLADTAVGKLGEAFPKLGAAIGSIASPMNLVFKAFEWGREKIKEWNKALDEIDAKGAESTFEDANKRKRERMDEARKATEAQEKEADNGKESKRLDAKWQDLWGTVYERKDPEGAQAKGLDETQASIARNPLTGFRNNGGVASDIIGQEDQAADIIARAGAGAGKGRVSAAEQQFITAVASLEAGHQVNYTEAIKLIEELKQSPQRMLDVLVSTIDALAKHNKKIEALEAQVKAIKAQ